MTFPYRVTYRTTEGEPRTVVVLCADEVALEEFIVAGGDASEMEWEAEDPDSPEARRDRGLEPIRPARRRGETASFQQAEQARIQRELKR